MGAQGAQKGAQGAQRGAQGAQKGAQRLDTEEEVKNSVSLLSQGKSCGPTH